jgi:hypothetical protein
LNIGRDAPPRCRNPRQPPKVKEDIALSQLWQTSKWCWFWQSSVIIYDHMLNGNQIVQLRDLPTKFLGNLVCKQTLITLIWSKVFFLSTKLIWNICVIIHIFYSSPSVCNSNKQPSNETLIGTENWTYSGQVGLKQSNFMQKQFIFSRNFHKWRHTPRGDGGWQIFVISGK